MREVCTLRHSKVLLPTDKANERDRLIPYTEFYNAAVSSLVDLAKEYKAWKSGNKLVFSLCRYPFLFSTTAKINILHIHARYEMGIQVNQVCLLISLQLGEILRIRAHRHRHHAGTRWTRRQLTCLAHYCETPTSHYGCHHSGSLLHLPNSIIREDDRDC